MINTEVTRVLVVARTFTNKVDGGAQKVKDVLPLIEACELLTAESGVEVGLRLVVPSCTDYDQCDKGGTYQYLIEASRGRNMVRTIETYEDPISGCLNEAAKAAHAGNYSSHVLFVSPSAASYLNLVNFKAMLNACAKGALVVGLSLEEVPGEVMDNSFAMWNLAALKAVNWFDNSSSAVRKDETDRQTVDVLGEQIPLQGVEEVRPLIRLIKLLGGKRCFAYLNPPGGGQRKLSTDPLRMEQDRKKNLSKEIRRKYMAAMEFESLSILETGRMTEEDLAL